MKWEEFLKPDLRKILLTLIIIISWILLLRFIISNTLVFCKMCPGYWPNACPGGNYINYLIVPELCPCCVSLSEVYNNYLWNLILPLVVSYFLSCFIFLIYNVVKKKK